jgi:hypothetical protein
MAEIKEESEVPLTNNFKLIDLVDEIMSWDIYHDFKKLQRIRKIIESICSNSEIKDKTIELAKKLADFNNWKIEEEENIAEDEVISKQEETSNEMQ